MENRLAIMQEVFGKGKVKYKRTHLNAGEERKRNDQN